MDNKNIEEQFIMKVDTNIKLSSVILSDDNLQKINEFIEEIKNTDSLVEYGLLPMNRLMFYGDSGTGKTFLGKALSNHLGYKLLYVDIASALSGGTVADNLKQIFSLAGEGKCIIFLDEVDSIAWSRDGRNEESGDVRRATNSLFQLIDQMHYSNIVLAATNMLHRLDPAFKARFNLSLEFRRQKLNTKDTVLKFIKNKFEVLDDVDETSENIINRRVDLSYRELEFIVNRNMKRAVMSGTNIIKTSDIFRDLSIAVGLKINI